MHYTVTPKLDALLDTATALGFTVHDILVGSAALGLSRLRDVRDLDILVSPKRYQDLVEREPPHYIKSHRIQGLEGDMIAYITDAGMIQVSFRMSSFAAGCTLDEREVRDRAVRHQDHAGRFWRALHWRALDQFKREAGRAKDYDDRPLVTQLRDLFESAV